MINRLPTLVLQNLSPFEKLFGKLPHFRFLNLLVCASFVLLQPHEHRKLEPWASSLYCFLGYGIDHKGFRCWDPISNKFLISCHVTFWENNMFSSHSKFHHSVNLNSLFFTDLSNELFPSSNIGRSDSLNINSSSPSPIAFASFVDHVLAHAHIVAPATTLRHST